MLSGIILSFFSPASLSNNINNLDGTIATQNEIKMAGIKTILLSIPVFSFLLALLFSLIPYKGVSYKNKYLRVAIIIMIVFNVLVSLGYLTTYFQTY